MLDYLGRAQLETIECYQLSHQEFCPFCLPERVSVGGRWRNADPSSARFSQLTCMPYVDRRRSMLDWRLLSDICTNSS